MVILATIAFVLGSVSIAMVALLLTAGVAGIFLIRGMCRVFKPLMSICGLLATGMLVMYFVSFGGPRSSHRVNAQQNEIESQASESAEIDYDAFIKKIEEPRIDLTQETSESAHPPAELSEDSIESGNTKPVDPKMANDENLLATEEGRPEWIDETRKRVGNVQRRVVKIGPWESVEECHRALAGPVLGATYQYMRQEFPDTEFSREDLATMGIDESYVMHEVCAEEFVEKTTHDFAGEDREMSWLHVLMEFSPSVHDELEQRVADFHRQQQATLVTILAGGVLGAIGLFYGLLKVDTWTKGYYSRRLWLGVPAAVATTLAALGFFMVA